ncbi:P-loop containing nucleoside triphosphate hydrolase protein [Punctularia strigosozonata HHB-11173 SS5]|uniref:p-loop containing nucleoside triphosphate hydrolase protein n=1 Tax=Punctularia strigosozonata (strain HHB-11173) TaxID=741275 RepID=R7S110_PUNST|nr:P-loop containing nucleoside triphosphate hydrolase protein [Punctularia strigosozonata HHB-11173 SS5]EIN03903.1 P-loop containing nucleoside triphosphate hydrolase protein [Punctularia strigosozonata HHB-11173 SS5]
MIFGPPNHVNPLGKGLRAFSAVPAHEKIFKVTNAAKFLAAAGTTYSIPKLHGLPEVIVAGRANVGKSTLLNAVLGRRDLVHTSSKPGRTQSLNFYRVGPTFGPGKLVVVDAPGYGARGRPEWGEIFDYYIDHREQLRRIYILLNAKHGLNEMDRMMLESLNAKTHANAGTRFSLQAIVTKVDAIPLEDVKPTLAKIRQGIWEAAPLCLPAIVTTAAKHPYIGIDAVRKSIVEACGLQPKV